MVNTAVYKIYNDGSHFVASLLAKPGGRKPTTPKAPDLARDLFDVLYLSALRAGKQGEDLKAELRAGLLSSFPELSDHIETYLNEQIERTLQNLYRRKKRAYRKANMHKWTYFITITYDGEKMSEDEFKRKLKKCLANFHTRRGWRYMGVFERGELNDRLHFHALLYVPAGEMVGELFERKQYSTKRHQWETVQDNTFFAERFGNCEFDEIDEKQMRYGNAAGYILKYLEKSDERLVYSRGIPDHIYMALPQSAFVCKFLDFVDKFVLFDSVIDSEHIAEYRGRGISDHFPDRYDVIDITPHREQMTMFS